jgi:hypothetical protein
VNALEAALRRIATDLDAHHRQWALVGGFAVSARAEPRFTRDIDAAVMVADDADSEELVRSLLASRYRCLGSMSVLSAPMNPSKFSLSGAPRPACLLSPPIESAGKKSRCLAR